VHCCFCFFGGFNLEEWSQAWVDMTWEWHTHLGVSTYQLSLHKYPSSQHFWSACSSRVAFETGEKTKLLDRGSAFELQKWVPRDFRAHNSSRSWCFPNPTDYMLQRSCGLSLFIWGILFYRIPLNRRLLFLWSLELQPVHWSGRFLDIIGWDSSVCKSNHNIIQIHNNVLWD
jgi:hypothetical protein